MSKRTKSGGMLEEFFLQSLAEEESPSLDTPSVDTAASVKSGRMLEEFFLQSLAEEESPLLDTTSVDAAASAKSMGSVKSGKSGRSSASKSSRKSTAGVGGSVVSTKPEPPKEAAVEKKVEIVDESTNVDGGGVSEMLSAMKETLQLIG